MHLQKAAALLLSSRVARATSASSRQPPLVGSSGQTAYIPNWDLQSSSQVGKDLASLSKPGLDTSSWYHTPSSRCTSMGCLLDAGIYNDTELWFSDNLNSFNWGQFSVPWVYRNEFALSPGAGQHFILQTNGITSKADVFFNGHQLANNLTQVGAYGGHTYDVSDLVLSGDNALLIQTYPTDYNYDFAEGFVDWNPYPPDNGTGVWRNVSIKQTGPVSLAPMNIVSDFNLPVGSGDATITVRAMIQNLEKEAVTVLAEVVVTGPGAGQPPLKVTQKVTLGPLGSTQLELSTTVKDPQIWWPKQWGSQPLYTASLSCSVDGAVSDQGQENLGIRKVTKVLNAYNDTMFSVNGQPFQVLGAGYGPDMFLRWDSERFSNIVTYMLDMGLNALRLEGKLEQPEMYEIADQMGLLIMPGWECCDKWEAWSYNDELSISPVPVFDANDYQTVNASMRHEAAMLQTHPSVLTYLVGSDYWPDDEATAIYVDALNNVSWPNPIVCSAGKLGYPELLGPSGIKMDGPYDWVPPNYWYDTVGEADRLGAAFGFGSELGAGVGTPEMGSLKQFLTQQDMDDLWQHPDKGLFHMSTNVSSFHDRSIYNEGLWKRYGAPTSLDDYLLKAQVMDYEATRAQYEGFSSQWNAARPATGAVYWMLNNAWPSLHWNQFDHYLHPAGSYFGTKVGARTEHVAYDYLHHTLWLINHALDRSGPRTVQVEIADLKGEILYSEIIATDTVPNTSRSIGDLSSILFRADSGVVFLRVVLSAPGQAAPLSRNVYWVSKTIDTLDWDNATWYYTPVVDYADYTSLAGLQPAQVSVTASRGGTGVVTLENHSAVPAFFIRLDLVDGQGNDVVPVIWSDNYVTLFPHETLELSVSSPAGVGGAAVAVSGWNIKDALVGI